MQDILLSTNYHHYTIEDIINLCSTSTSMRRACATLAFWKPIFERHHLPQPSILPITVSQWIDTFIETKQLKQDVDYIMEMLFLGRPIVLKTQQIIPIQDILLKIKMKQETHYTFDKRYSYVAEISLIKLIGNQYQVTISDQELRFNNYNATEQQTRDFLTLLLRDYGFQFDVIEYD